MSSQAVVGMPGIKTERSASQRRVRLTDVGLKYLPAGKIINGSKSRDPGNTGDLDVLRAGIVMGKISSSGKYAPSILGLTSEDLTISETALDVPEAVGDEIVRRIGSSGTFKLTGPPTAAGVVRTLPITFASVAAAAGGTRTITMTSGSVNEVQTIAFGAAASGGTFKIGFTLASGAVVWTDTIAYSATDATFLASMNTAIDNVLGAGLVVATAISATDTDLGFVLTFSGTGYAGLPQSLVAIDAAALTSVSTVTVTRTTAGVDGRFVSASILQPTDGSETPKCLVDDGFGIKVTDEDALGIDVQFPNMLIGGILDASQIINYPADASLITWLKAQLDAVGSFEFDDDF